MVADLHVSSAAMHFDASASEVCRFGGTTDGAGHVAITTDVAAMNGVTRIEVEMTFETTGMFWLPIHYLVDEISTWRMGEMEGLAVNTRYLVGDRIARQQWDTFQRGPDGLQAHRVQAKRLPIFAIDTQASSSIGIPRPLAPPGFRTINSRHRSAVPISTLKPYRFHRDCAPRSPWPSTGLGGCRTAAKTCRYSCLASRLISLSRSRLRAPLRSGASCGGHPCTTRRSARGLRPAQRP